MLQAAKRSYDELQQYPTNSYGVPPMTSPLLILRAEGALSKPAPGGRGVLRRLSALHAQLFDKHIEMLLLWSFLLILVFFQVWDAMYEIFGYGDRLANFASSGEIKGRGWELARTPGFMVHLSATLTATGGGFLIGTFAGIVLGALATLSRVGRVLFSALLLPLYAAPKALLVPAIALWLGHGGLETPTLIVSLTLFVTVGIATVVGILLVPKEYVEASRIDGATPLQTLIRIQLRLSWLPILMGMALGVSKAFPLVTGVEMLNGGLGLGVLETRLFAQSDVAGGYSIILISLAISMAISWVGCRIYLFVKDRSG